MIDSIPEHFSEWKALIVLVGVTFSAIAGVLIMAWQLGLWSRISVHTEDDEEIAPGRVLLSLIVAGAAGWVAWRLWVGLPILP